MPIPASFKYFQTSAQIIRLAVMLYIRLPLSLRNVEDLLHERGIDVGHETIRYWWNRFGPAFAAEIRRKRVQQLRAFSKWRWHVDEAFVKVNGKRHYLWRAGVHESEVPEAVVEIRRNKAAALKFLKKLVTRQGFAEEIGTDRFACYKAALRELGALEIQRTGTWLNNRIENSHPPFRQRKRAMQRFRRMRRLKKFDAVRSSIYKHLNQERSLSTRDNFKMTRAAALAQWRWLCSG
jgi:putative transposase